MVREFSPVSSNWRSTEVADEYLERNGVPVIAEIDTRAVVRHLRAHGVMRGVISTAVGDPDALVEKARGHAKMDGTDLASGVTTKVTVYLGRGRAFELNRRHAAAGGDRAGQRADACGGV